MDTKWGKRWGGGSGGVMNWAIGIDMYTLMCIKLMTKKKKKTVDGYCHTIFQCTLPQHLRGCLFPHAVPNTEHYLIFALCQSYREKNVFHSNFNLHFF